MKPILDIIIPTWNNPQYFDPCMMSILSTGVFKTFGRIIVVNNGKQPIKDQFGHVPNVVVLDTEKNLGWEGGLKRGLENSDAEFVCFQNDDTFIPNTLQRFYNRLVLPFFDDSVGLVGPVTTVASGVQSVYHNNSPLFETEVRWLIFFTVAVRRKFLDELGGIDSSLPGGDDFDLSMRMLKAGKKILIKPEAFLIHHGFKTGQRIYGDGYAGIPNGWNSPQMIERTQTALIKKHGFRDYFTAMQNQVIGYYKPERYEGDKEGDLIRSFLNGHGSILELGCGGKKTVEKSVGVDRIPKGEIVPYLGNVPCIAEVCADVTKKLPFSDASQDAIIARHIFEHCMDTISTLKEWSRVIKTGGRLIVAVPDDEVTRGIPMNPEHCHAFTAASLRTLAETCGFKIVDIKSSENGVSLVACFEKNGH